MNVYLDLSRTFNAGALRAILSSGQAVVLHRLAVMSKDGDWILRETPEALGHVLQTLAARGACYRFGAPLDVRWMRGGWSAHFEFREGALRVRTDFVTRPPRIPPDRLAAVWAEPAAGDIPFVGVRDLIELKKTNREKDYPVIGDLARMLTDPLARMLQSRSAQDLLRMADEHPAALSAALPQRPALAAVALGRDALEAALDDERRRLMRANEARLAAYLDAARPWADLWPAVEREIAGLPLGEAHAIVVARARGVLPFDTEGPSP